MKPPDELARRRARVQRLAAKRPEGVRIEATHAPEPAALDALVDVLVELLDARARSRPR